MTEKTTIAVTAETKGYLDGVKMDKESYDKAIGRMIKQSETNKDPRYVTLRMTQEEFKILKNRQEWKICIDILKSALV